MQIESILIFVVLIALSSLTNKRKQAQQQRKKQQTVTTRQSDIETASSPVETSSQKSKQPKGKRTLQDILREMQNDLAAESQEKEIKEESKENKTTPIHKEKSTKKAQKKKSIPEPSKEVKQQSPIYANEIKDNLSSRRLQVNQQSIYNGIVFSEILGKPKGHRKN
ncbi:hypothetical protein SAMN05192551_101591 [Tindallia magadiensis]|uniref:Uncharacterized protein n=1 Tax=Tindallia magadiensis TaxID=69895 RepID=A0A1I3B504_9FIRM|nr:hypothetical protein [Tindallia magadiensis]SFH57353.1 hypothetical protein SAMN05192551_101591 [Tindallia magadiensis]